MLNTLDNIDKKASGLLHRVQLSYLEFLITPFALIHMNAVTTSVLIILLNTCFIDMDSQINS